MNLDFNDKEMSVLHSLATKQETSELKVLQHALATYQLIVAGTHKLVEINPLSKMAPYTPSRSCNRHDDCAKAEEELLAKYPQMKKVDISFSFHCHDEDCEDCFGS